VFIDRHLDQLRRNADLLAGAEHRAFYYRVYIQLPRDFRKGRMGFLGTWSMN
jgi:hypothetical protein